MGIFRLRRKTFSIESGKGSSSTPRSVFIASGALGSGISAALCGPALVGSIVGAGINAVRGKGIAGTVGGFFIGGAITTLAGISIGSILGLREYIKLSNKDVVEGKNNKVFYDLCLNDKMSKQNNGLTVSEVDEDRTISSDKFKSHVVVNQPVNKQSVTITFNCSSSLQDLGSGVITLYKPSTKLMELLNNSLRNMINSIDLCGKNSYTSEKVDDGYIIQVISSPKIFYRTIISDLVRSGYLINYVY